MFRRVFSLSKSVSRVAHVRTFSHSSVLLNKSMTIDDNFDPKAVEEQIAKIKAEIEEQKQKEKIAELTEEIIVDEKQPEFLSESKSGSFKAETSKLLNIVAESLYSDSQVFIREFVANASDAIEKARLDAGLDRDFLIQVRTDKANNTITFIDNGIGMNLNDVEELLGTIAKSGSKAYAVAAEADDNKEKAENIIGQFGVGFYSSFMVGSKVEVFTKKHNEENGVYWVSDGINDYNTRSITNCEEGTKIVIHLKGNHRDYCDPSIVKGILEKNCVRVG